MKFFADTANIDAINEVNDLGILDGVTTNPSLMAKEGIKGTEAIYEHYKKIAKICGTGPVSAEVISTDFKGMMDEAYKLAKLADNIIVKIPMIKDGVKAIKALHLEGIKTNCTLIFSSAQAIRLPSLSKYVPLERPAGLSQSEVVPSVLHLTMRSLG